MNRDVIDYKYLPIKPLSPAWQALIVYLALSHFGVFGGWIVGVFWTLAAIFQLVAIIAVVQERRLAPKFEK